jgi:hypothetical protein
LIPNNQIPAISFQSATVVNGEPAMLALNNAVIGSIAIRTDNSKNFVLSVLPASTVGNWIELVSPASVTSVNGNAGPTVNLGVADIPNAESLLNKTTATDLGNTNPSDVLYPSQKAVKTYIDAQTAAAGVLDGSITNAKLAGSITAGKLVGTDISIVGTIATGVWSASSIGLTKGGTGATNAADARTNLGLVIGTNVQAPLTSGTDYLTPTGSAASLTNFPTLNQNTTGNAATATLATNATYATTAGDITSTSNNTLTSLSNLNTVGTITTGTISLTTNIKTTNTLTTGAVTYPNIHGSIGQVLSTTGSGTLTWTTVSTTADAATLSGTVAINKGGTGASTSAEALTNLGAAPINANLNNQIGTTYTLLASDNGKVVTLENASAITLTVPAGLDAGFNCMIVQKGAGVVTITPANTVTVTNRSGGTKTGGQNAIVTIISISSNYFITGGDMQ